MGGVKYNQSEALNAMMPARRCRAVTPHATNPVSSLGPCDALFIGTGGTISVIAEDDTDPVSFTVPGGFYLQVRAARVLAVGTTATGIVALY